MLARDWKTATYQFLRNNAGKVVYNMLFTHFIFLHLLNIFTPGLKMVLGTLKHMTIIFFFCVFLLRFFSKALVN